LVAIGFRYMRPVPDVARPAFREHFRVTIRARTSPFRRRRAFRTVTVCVFHFLRCSGLMFGQISFAAKDQFLEPLNIEFSCPAASTQHRMELPGCIHRSRRPLRGQLQRFVRMISFQNPYLGSRMTHG
jgi:hypothetical protein